MAIGSETKAPFYILGTDVQYHKLYNENIVDQIIGLGRRPSYEYSVGDVVLCAGSMSLQLICTVAGTTSIDELDITGKMAGDSIVDGTVTWIVAKRNHFNNDGVLPISEGGTGASSASQACANIGAVRSVNGVGADSNGNVLLDTMPIGTIFAFAGKNIPSGYLSCNGSAVSRTTYSNLYQAIGTTYGSGNGSTTFNLPNLESNTFMEFADNAGIKKNAGLPNITGSFDIYKGTVYIGSESLDKRVKTTGAYSAEKGSLLGNQAAEGYSSVKVNFDASKGGSTIYGRSTTVQPKSLTVRAIIKY